MLAMLHTTLATATNVSEIRASMFSEGFKTGLRQREISEFTG